MFIITKRNATFIHVHLKHNQCHENVKIKYENTYQIQSIFLGID